MAAPTVLNVHTRPELVTSTINWTIQDFPTIMDFAQPGNVMSAPRKTVLPIAEILATTFG
jgi:hypothetical protein